jgi:hypothetical protein
MSTETTQNIIQSESFDPSRLVSTVDHLETVAKASVLLGLVLDAKFIDESTCSMVAEALGDGGQDLIRRAIVGQMQKRVAEKTDAGSRELNSMLVAAGLITAPEFQTLRTSTRKTIRARIAGIASARRRADGSVWGFLRLETSPKSFENMEFTFRDGILTVCDDPCIY